MVARMCARRSGRSVGAMLNTSRIHAKSTSAAALVAVAAALAVVAPAPQDTHAAGGRTEILKTFSETASFTFTPAGGTPIPRPPEGPPQAGDVLEIDSLVFRGTHRRHATKPLGSTYLRCEFTAAPEPTCTSVSAIGGSLLRFRGMDLVGGTGRYQGATGKVVKNQEVEGGADIVVRIKLP